MNWDSSLSCSGPSSRLPDSLSLLLHFLHFVAELRIAEPEENSKACAESNGEYKREDIIDALLVELFEQCLMLLRQVYLDLLWNALQKLVLEGGKVVDGGQKNIGIIQDACRHCLTTRTVGEVARRAVLTEVG